MRTMMPSKRGPHFSPRRTPRGIALAAHVLLALGAGAPMAYALDPKKGVQEYVLDQWDPRHGLPFTTVRSIRQTPDGYLWLGTRAGFLGAEDRRYVVDLLTLRALRRAPATGSTRP